MTEENTTPPEVDGIEPDPEHRDNAADELADGESVSDLPFEEEVAARSADTVKPSDHFTKVFVLGPGTYTAAVGFDHDPNKAATRQYAIDAGLWPTADVEHVSTKTHDDGVSKVLTYRVAVAPAHLVGPESPHPEVVGEVGTRDTDAAQNADAREVEKTDEA